MRGLIHHSTGPSRNVPEQLYLDLIIEMEDLI